MSALKFQIKSSYLVNLLLISPPKLNSHIFIAGSVLYASESAFFVYTSDYSHQASTSVIAKWELTGIASEPMKFVSFGQVEGTIINVFAMDQFKGTSKQFKKNNNILF